jgi:hypothetical protein
MAKQTEREEKRKEKSEDAGIFGVVLPTQTFPSDICSINGVCSITPPTSSTIPVTGGWGDFASSSNGVNLGLEHEIEEVPSYGWQFFDAAWKSAALVVLSTQLSKVLQRVGGFDKQTATNIAKGATATLIGYCTTSLTPFASPAIDFALQYAGVSPERAGQIAAVSALTLGVYLNMNNPMPFINGLAGAISGVFAVGGTMYLANKGPSLITNTTEGVKTFVGMLMNQRQGEVVHDKSF